MNSTSTKYDFWKKEYKLLYRVILFVTYLLLNDKQGAWLSLIPAVITSVVKLGNIKNHTKP